MRLGLRGHHVDVTPGLRRFVEEKLSKLELPAEIEFRDELPKTLIGKLSKRELRAEAKR